MTPQNPLAAWKGLTFKRVHIADNVRICSQAAPRRIRGSRLSSEGDIEDIDWIEHVDCDDKRLIGPFGRGGGAWGAGLLCNMLSAASAYLRDHSCSLWKSFSRFEIRARVSFRYVAFYDEGTFQDFFIQSLFSIQV